MEALETCGPLLDQAYEAPVVVQLMFAEQIKAKWRMDLKALASECS